MDQKILSREWVWDNIFDLTDGDKKEIFEQMVEDQKQKFRFEQIETEGNDPTKTGEKASEDDDLEMARKDDWGGDRRSGTEEKEYGNEYDAKDLEDATKYEKEKYGKREFKGGSPLYPGKGGTIVAREGLLNSLKSKFGNNNKSSILNEDILLEDEIK
jgi:hypothetical protein